jgi:replicative DNA helicase
MAQENLENQSSQQTSDSILEVIKTNRYRRLTGKYNSIVLPFSRLSRVFPGLEKGAYWIITASSGIGKTKVTKFITVTSVYDFCKKNNIPFKIFYFALEESKNDFWLDIVSYLLRLHYNLRISSTDLKSVGEDILSEDIVNKVESVLPIVEDMKKYIEVTDDISNGYGIYKKVRAYADANGTYEKIVTDDGQEFRGEYIPNNPEEYVLVITDHISLLQAESLNKVPMTHWQSINHFSQEYCLQQFCKKLKYITINVQQQSGDQEKQQFTHKGESIAQKLEPTLDGLADNKLTQRDATLVLGIFAPARYGIEEHRGYDITRLKDSYRSLKILKDRHYGLANTYIPLYMEGSCNFFKELPKSSEMTNEKYTVLENILKKL